MLYFPNRTILTTIFLSFFLFLSSMFGAIGSAQAAAPVAIAASYTVKVNTAITKLLGATDADGGVLFYSLGTDAVHGSINIQNAYKSVSTSTSTSTGSFTYTPDTGYVGVDSFTFRVTDETGASATAKISLTITKSTANAAPIALDQSYSLNEDSYKQATLTATDANGDNLSFTVQTAPLHGSLTIDAVTDVFTYRPSANFNGADSFVYQVSDGRGGIDTATARLTIVAINDAPTTVNSSFNLNEDTTVTRALTATDPEKQTLTYALITTVAHGTLTLTAATGTYTYRPLANYKGADQFQYRVTDPNGLIATATVSITVMSIDDVPVAASDSVSSAVNAVSTISVLTNDLNLGDGGIVVTLISNPAYGQASVSSNRLVYTPATNYSGLVSMNYRVTDIDGDVTTATASVNIACTSNCTTTGTVSLRWLPPTTKTDGTSLSNLAGYLVYYGTSPGSYTRAVDVANPTASSFSLTGLTPGTYYITVAAYDSLGNESGFSNAVTKIIP